MANEIGKAVVPIDFDAEEAKKGARKVGTELAKEAGKGSEKESKEQGKKSGKSLTEGMADGVSGSAKILTAAIAGVAAAGIAGVAAATSRALDREVSSDKIAAQIGLNPQEQERLGRVAGKLYGGAYGEGLSEVNSAFRGIQTNIGSLSKFSDEALESMGAKAFDVASIMGEEVGAVTRGVGQMLRTNMVKDATEAFDLIAAASQRLPESMQGELLETIEEYGQDFRELGFTGKQAMGVLISGVEAGARNIDLAADAFREFSDIITEGGKRPADALKAIGLNADGIQKAIAKGGPAATKATSDVIRALQKVKDPIKRGVQGVELFGTKWLDAGEEAVLAMDPLKDVLGDVNGRAAAVGDTLAGNVSTKIETFKRKVEGVFVQFFGDKVVPALEKFVDWASKKLAPILEDIGPVIEGIGRKVGEFINAALPYIKDFGKFLSDNKDVIMALVPWVLGLGVAIKGIQIATKVQSWIGGAVGSIFGLGKESEATAEKVAGKSGGRLGGLVGALSALQAAVGLMGLGKAKEDLSGFDKVADGIANSGYAAALLIGGLPGLVIGTVSTVVSYRKELQAVYGSFPGILAENLGKTVHEMELMVEASQEQGMRAASSWEIGFAGAWVDANYEVVEDLDQVEKAMYDFLPDVMKVGKETSDSWWDSLGASNEAHWWELPDTMGRIANEFGSAKDDATSAGWDTIGGMYEGMKSKADSEKSWITRFSEGLVGSVKNFFGIKSPSRLMYGIGENVIDGMINGVLSKNPSGLINKAFGSMPSALGSIVGKGLIPINSLTSGAMAALSGVSGMFTKLFGGGKGGNAGNQAIGQALAAQVGWTGGQWEALKTLWNNESGWNNNAQNPTSTAYGIAQFLNSTWSGYGVAKTADPAGQITAGIRYIQQRYGTPANALATWQSRSPHWYDQGGWLMPGTTLVANHTGAPERVLGPGEVALGDGNISVTVMLDGQVIAAKTQVAINEAQSRSAFRATNGRR